MMRIASSRGVLPLGIMLNGSQNYYKIKLLIRNEKICAYYFYLKKNQGRVHNRFWADYLRDVCIILV